MLVADSGKDWEEIIPESLREKVDEEERQQQLLNLHLPPRSRKTIKQVGFLKLFIRSILDWKFTCICSVSFSPDDDLFEKTNQNKIKEY
jgi:hypothetical protein